MSPTPPRWSMISPGRDIFLIAAGVVAGVVGTAGGITSLVSYPALLLVGLPVLGANIANIVSIVACWPASALASRPELRGRGAWLVRWSMVTALGGAVGAGLLLVTTPGAFAVIVPYLLAFASLALLAQPHLSQWRARVDVGGERLFLVSAIVVIAAYNGYFGAGSGVMLLTLLMVMVEHHIARANALKNMLIGVAASVSALLLIIFGHVDWYAVVPLASGMFVGALLGPVVARSISATVLRWIVALMGLALAIRLWVAPL